MNGKEARGISRRGFLAGAGATTAALAASGLMAGCSNQTTQEPEPEVLANTGAVGIDPAEGKWVPTKCNMCFNRCGILAHVVDDVVVEIKGNPASGVGNGTICGKAQAGIMQLYDPNRITKPMKRTNPNKGLDQDPGWEEISWDDAYDLLISECYKAIAEDSTGLTYALLVANNQGIHKAGLFLGCMFGGVQFMDSDICGAGIHPNADTFSGYGNSQPDYMYCDYLVQFGTQAGFATRHGWNISAKVWSERRKNGAKTINFDPHMSAAADKADLWVPIRPGTDAAAALAMSHVLVHELGIYDVDYLKERTNAPALVDTASGRIIRDAKSEKTLYMDADGKAKPYDEVTDPQLEGEFEVEGKKCKTGFTLLKEHLALYTPEYQEPITTVSADTIRQIAKEFGEAAKIGETIDIDGVTMRYRPVSTDFFSGVSRHKHSTLSVQAIMLPNVLVGACNSVGGHIAYAGACNGFAPGNPTVTWRPGLWEKDGLITASGLMALREQSVYQHIEEIADPAGSLDMLSIMPLAIDPHFYFVNQCRPDYYDNGAKPSKMLLAIACNPLKWWGNHDEMADMLRGYDFVAGIDIYLNDSSYFYDLILPEACYLERYDIMPNVFNGHHTPGHYGTDWSTDICQPVVAARDGAPSLLEILCEMADRTGSNEIIKGAIAGAWGIKPEYALSGPEKIDIEELQDAVFKSWIDEEHDLAWFKENGCYTKPREVDEVYIWANDVPGRVPLYGDYMLEAGERVKAIIDEKGYPWELDDWQAFPDYKTCNEHSLEADGEYDIFPIYWTDALNVDTWSMENAWVNEINERDERIYAIEINKGTADAKSLTSGDEVRLVTREGVSVQGKLVVSEGIHPECVSVVGGHWGATSSFVPIAQNKGVPINHLMSGIDPARLDHTSAAYDQCCRVKIEKI